MPLEIQESAFADLLRPVVILPFAVGFQGLGSRNRPRRRAMVRAERNRPARKKQEKEGDEAPREGSR
ncbi:MAG: hypothetical protein ABI682_10440 [Acidobacteriota bacterium]